MDWILKKEDSTERDREKFGSSNNFFFYLISSFSSLSDTWQKDLSLPEKKISCLKDINNDDTQLMNRKNIVSILLFTRSAQGGKLEKYTRIYNKILKYNSVCLRILHVGMTNAINNTIYGVYHHIIIWFTDVFSIKKI